METKCGKFMYEICDKGSSFLIKHKWMYYILACSWGIIMTLLGLIITSVLFIFGKKPKKYKGIYHMEIGKSWGGLEMGLMFLTHNNPSTYIKKHELGHTYQNAILGPPFSIIGWNTFCYTILV